MNTSLFAGRCSRLAVMMAMLLCGGALSQSTSAPTEPIDLTLTPILEETTTFTGQPLQFPGGQSQFTAVLAEVAPGGQVGHHLHPVPLFVYILEGTLTIEMEGHGTHAFSAGQGLVEVLHTWHNGRNLGDTPAQFLIVFADQADTPNLIRP